MSSSTYPRIVHALGSGVVVAIWSDGTVVASHDSGASWNEGTTSPVPLSHGAHSTSAPSGPLIIGRYEKRETGGWPLYDTWITRSFDAGTTWEAPFYAGTFGVLDDLKAIDADRVLIIASEQSSWSDNDDLFFGRSVDRGATWTAPFAPVSRRQGYDGFRALLQTSTDRWLLVWTSIGKFDDSRSVYVSSALDLCPAAPFEACVTADIGRARALLNDGPGERDTFAWQWSRAGSCSANLGDPLATSTYALCAYETNGGSHSLLFEKDARAAATSSTGAPLWRAVKDGFVYVDNSGQEGALKSLRIKAGSNATKLKVKVGGATFGPPNLPLSLAPEVRLQVRNVETGACWESSFTTAKTNDEVRFDAR
jgi:hypothetical protein